MTKQDRQKEYTARIKAWKKLNPAIKPGRGSKLSEKSRLEAISIGREGHAINEPLHRTAKRLGIGAGTLCRWGTESLTTAEPEPVEFEEPEATIELTLADGTKVTGITAAEAVSLLKALS